MKYINLFETQAEYDAAEKYYPNVSYIEATDEVVYQENSGLDYSRKYLTFEALEDGTFTLSIPTEVDSTKMTSISYSIDDGANWETTMFDNTTQTITTPTVNAGQKVLWKGVGYTLFASSFSSTGDFNVSGNIMSLLYGDNFARQTSFASGSSYNFVNLFYGAAKLISAGNLVLPATTLTDACYSGIFSDCTSLTTAPELPAIILSIECYSFMFDGCTALTTAPELPATTLATQCYSGMFSRCTSLATAPELPAITLADYCYESMFDSCSSLTTAPTLPATTLADSCYQGMFSGCESLTIAPELPATTLASECYSNMFYGCTSLTIAPELPATTLADGCYSNMFSGCINLNSITMLATDISATGCLMDWVTNVAATGTFTKDASMTTLPTGTSGIPENWTVVDA